MPFSPQFYSISTKIERASDHIEELHRELSYFWASDPIDIRYEDGPGPAERTYFVNKLEPVPFKVTTIIGDVLHNLRSSLDHLARELVLVNGGTPTRKTSFPIAGNAGRYASADYQRKLKGMKQAAIDAISALNPYKGGNDPLWRLNELNNIDKHRLLLTACATNTLRSTPPSKRADLIALFKACHPREVVPDLSNTLSPVDHVEPLKLGQRLCTIPLSELEPNTKFHFEVALNEPSVVPPKEIIEMLHSMKRVVVKIVIDFDGFLT